MARPQQKNNLQTNLYLRSPNQDLSRILKEIPKMEQVVKAYQEDGSVSIKVMYEYYLYMHDLMYCNLSPEQEKMMDNIGGRRFPPRHRMTLTEFTQFFGQYSSQMPINVERVRNHIETLINTKEKTSPAS